MKINSYNLVLTGREKKKIGTSKAYFITNLGKRRNIIITINQKFTIRTNWIE